MATEGRSTLLDEYPGHRPAGSGTAWVSPFTRWELLALSSTEKGSQAATGL